MAKASEAEKITLGLKDDRAVVVTLGAEAAQSVAEAIATSAPDSSATAMDGADMNEQGK
jgi:hypothetical protein